jgi:hypothetical protein
MMSSAIVRPMASPRDHPKTPTAQSFQSVTTPSDFITTTASRAVSKIRRSPSRCRDRRGGVDFALAMVDTVGPKRRTTALIVPRNAPRPPGNWGSLLGLGALRPPTAKSAVRRSYGLPTKVWLGARLHRSDHIGARVPARPAGRSDPRRACRCSYKTVYESPHFSHGWRVGSGGNVGHVPPIGMTSA